MAIEPEARRRGHQWLEEVYSQSPEREAAFETISGHPIRPLYTEEDLEGWDPAEKLGYPGSYPYTRGPYPSMYRGRLWTMRQFAGFGTVEETNRRFRYLLDHGQTGLSTAFDMPTLMGLDSDHERSLGEVGVEGVAVDTTDDMVTLFDGIPLDRVTVSMTINAPAAIALAFYVVAAEEKGIAPEQLGGTIQTDILKEYIAQKEWCFPIDPAMRLVTDMVEFCAHRMPRWHPISISGYHIREAGATAAQELAFTLKDGFTYVEHALERGLDIDSFAPRLSFFFNAHIDFFEEIAKYRAARRIWAREMRETYGARKSESMRLRFHPQTAGVSLTAQQPLNNIVRTAIEALAGVLGGTQSLHTNSFDEALALPTEEAVRVALRTQQIIAHETGVANTVDPLAGSYFVEKLTDELEEQAYEYFRRIDELGGMIAAIEHYTAVLGDFALNSRWDDFGADPTMVDLFRWHGSEEVEHRSVAYDVARYFHDSYLHRIRAMSVAATAIYMFFQRGTWFLLRKDPRIDMSWWRMQVLRMRDSRLGLLPKFRTVFGTATLSYFRPGFSPEEMGSTAQAVAYLATSPAARAAHL